MVENWGCQGTLDVKEMIGYSRDLYIWSNSDRLGRKATVMHALFYRHITSMGFLENTCFVLFFKRWTVEARLYKT